MKPFLAIVFLQILAVSSVKLSSNGRREKIVAESQRQVPTNLTPAGPYCQSLVAYVVGTFQSKNSQTPSFSAEFQVRLDANLKTKRITVSADQWNENYSNSSDFYLDFYDELSQQWCDIKEEDCSSSFVRDVSTFKLDLNRNDGNYFHLLYFDYFNNSFVLNQPTGSCTKHQLDGINDSRTPDLDDLNICVCCGDYDASALLNCPADPWKDATPAPATTASTPPPSVACQSIVAYWKGTFRNTAEYDAVFVEFQARMSADDENVYYEIDHWNEDDTYSKDIHLYGLTDAYKPLCGTPTKDNCSIWYVPERDLGLLLAYYQGYDWENSFHFLNFPSFNGQFVLQNSVGQCTNFQPEITDEFAVDPRYFNFCSCCGEYLPDPSLNCPKNPWA